MPHSRLGTLFLLLAIGWLFCGSLHGAIQTFRNEIPRTSLFTGNDVRSLYRDRSGSIWIGTTRGLNIFDPATEKCEQYRSDNRNAMISSDDYISSILEDSRGTMWIGTRNGVKLFNRRMKSFTSPGDTSKLPGEIKGALSVRCLKTSTASSGSERPRVYFPSTGA